MKRSQFNHMVESDGVFILFNALTSSLAVVNEKAFHLLQNGDISALSPHIVTSLAKGGFIVPPDTDELSIFRHRWYAAYHDTTAMGVSISPTMQCNMKCSYCLAHRDSSVMTGNTADRLIEFLCRWMHPAKRFSINWFGGEPLLALDIVTHVSQNVSKAARQAGKQFSGSMYTNAYDLKPEIVDKLKQTGITNLFVSIDGPRDVHERRRPHVLNQPCFDRIMKNVYHAAEKLTVTVQCVVDTDNKDDAWKLYNQLNSAGRLGCDLRFRIGRTDCDVVANPLREESVLSRNQFDLLYIEQLSKRKHFPGLGLPYPSFNTNCTYHHTSALTIDPDGDMYKCLRSGGLKHRSIGNLDNPPTLSSPGMNRWLRIDPSLRQSCSQCSILPVCSGGCPFIFIDTGTSRCSGYKWSLAEWLKLIVDWRRESR